VKFTDIKPEFEVPAEMQYVKIFRFVKLLILSQFLRKMALPVSVIMMRILKLKM